MTTHHGGVATQKPPITKPKPVLKESTEVESLNNGNFHQKLQAFEQFAKSSKTEKENEKSPAYQTRTIRRKPKKTDKSCNQKDYERLNVSPVRRKPSIPVPQAKTLPKKRTGSDSSKESPDEAHRNAELKKSHERATDGSERVQPIQRQKSRTEKPLPPKKPAISSGPVTHKEVLNDSDINQGTKDDHLHPVKKSSEGGDKSGVKISETVQHSGGHERTDEVWVKKEGDRPTSQGASCSSSIEGKKFSKPPVQKKPKPAVRLEENEKVEKRISVLDLVGNFEGKRNTRTLGRVTKKGGGAKGINLHHSGSPFKPGGLTRRLSRSLGNINEVSSFDQTQGLNAKDKIPPIVFENKLLEQTKGHPIGLETGSSKVTSEVASSEKPQFQIPKPKRTFAQEECEKIKSQTNLNEDKENTGAIESRKEEPPPPPQAVDNAPKVILRDKARRSLTRSRKGSRRGTVDKPGYAPPQPPAAYKTPNSTLNRNSTSDLPVVPINKKAPRPKSDISFMSSTIYATPEIDPTTGLPLQRHRYHVLENHNSLPLDDDFVIFGTNKSSQTVEDEGGYTIPGSHLWGIYATPVIDNGTGTPPATEPPTTCQSDNRPRSNNNAVPPGIHGYTEPTVPEGNSNNKDKQFKPKLNKMRRKIHEAFRGKGKAEDDSVSVTSEDSDEIDDALTEKRLTAVRKVKARTSHYCSLETARKKYYQYAKLYEYVVVVSLKYDETQRRYEPCEIRRFPHEVSDSQNDKLRAIPYFCFPDSFKWAPVESYNSETFSFVLTSFDGSRFYGYNRRLLPPGEGARLPEVFCVMSPVPCYPLYYQLLDEIERRRKHSMEEVEVLLKVAYEKFLPRPGSNVRISADLNSQLSVKDGLCLQRPQDSRLEQIDFDYLFKNLSIPHVLQIFGSLLLERRIVMFSSYLSKLSKCSQAIAALLYPFAWQHVYVPVLPQKLLDMCCSPTPYIMGMLSLSIPELEDMPLEEVLIVNLDAGEFDVHVGDEDTILPRRLSIGLDKALQTCMRESLTLDLGDTPDKQLTDCETRNKSISEAFILFFVELMGHYLNHFQQSQDGKMVFDRDSFIKGTNSKSIKRFLEVFTETQMFSLFIQEKETESDEGILQSLFDQRIQGYESERRNSKLLGVVNVKKIGQKLAGTAKGVKVKVKAFDDKI